MFTSRRAAASGAALYPTFGHDGLFTFSWGVRRDVQVTAQFPVVTKRLDLPLGAEEGGTGLGDLQLHLKYRFLRRDSKRGTTQASLRIGPKLPTGRTDSTHRIQAEAATETDAVRAALTKAEEWKQERRN